MNNKLSRQQKLEVIQRYKNGESLTSLCKVYGVYNRSISRILEHAGVQVRDRAQAAKLREQLHPTEIEYVPTEDEIAEMAAVLKAKHMRKRRAETTKGYRKGEHHIRCCEIFPHIQSGYNG